jgi:hypothetical protein
MGRGKTENPHPASRVGLVIAPEPETISLKPANGMEIVGVGSERFSSAPQMHGGKRGSSLVRCACAGFSWSESGERADCPRFLSLGGFLIVRTTGAVTTHPPAL